MTTDENNFYHAGVNAPGSENTARLRGEEMKLFLQVVPVVSNFKDICWRNCREPTMTTDENNFYHAGATAPGSESAARLRGEEMKLFLQVVPVV